MTDGGQADTDHEQPRPFGDAAVRDQLRERRARLSPPLSPRQREQRAAHEAARRELAQKRESTDGEP
jgi:hypothetical protein